MSRQMLIMIFFMVSAWTTQAAVTVRLPAKDLTFEQAPRLSDVLSYTAEDRHTYWPAAALFRQDEALSLQHQQFLAELLRLHSWFEQRGQLAFAEEVQLLHQDMAQWQVARRQPVRVHPDLARWQIHYNPRLDAGDYLLRYGPRAESIFTGGLYHQTSLAYRPATPVSKYLDVSLFGRLADRNYIWVLSPSGDIQRVGIRAWNDEPVQVMPGSLLLVLFHEKRLPTGFRHLNQQLFELAKHRVPPQ